MKRVRQWISQLMVTWRSVLSWMHWRRRARLRAEQQLELLIKRLMTEQMNLMQEQMLTPLAGAIQQAMQRQDTLAQTRADQQSKDLTAIRSQMQELMEEVLKTVQPDQEALIKQRIGLPAGQLKPLPSSLSSTR